MGDIDVALDGIRVNGLDVGRRFQGPINFEPEAGGFNGETDHHAQDHHQNTLQPMPARYRGPQTRLLAPPGLPQAKRKDRQ
ncbi:hypothetical protein D3C78_973460 [compost metagenome]